MAKRRAQRKDESAFVGTTIGVLSGTKAIEPFSRRAALDSYGSWIAAATDTNAKAIASVPLRLYVPDRSGTNKSAFPLRKLGKRRKAYLCGDARRSPSRSVVTKAASGEGEYMEVTDHPLLDLLYAVNPWDCGFSHLQLTATFIGLTGNAYWFKVRGAFGVESVWQLPPQYTWVVPDAGMWIRGYEYRPRSGYSVEFTPDEVIHFKTANPRSPWYGIGNVEKAWYAVSANASRHVMDVSFYDNFGRPDYVWIIKNAQAKQENIDAFTAQMEQRLRGVRKHGKNIAVTGEVDLKPLQWSPKESANDTPTIEEIAAICGVPVSMLMANDPNLASAEVGYRWWREQTIAPLCRMIEDVLNQSLVPEFDVGEGAFLAFDDPVPENETEEYDTRVKLVGAAIMTPNEARVEDGDEPIDDPMADMLLFNGQPLGGASMSSQPQPSPNVGAVANATDAPETEVPANDARAAASDPNAAVQDTALNGAQVTALVDLVNQARTGMIPVDAAQAIASAAFPLMTDQQLSAIFNPVRSAPPLPTPEPATSPVAQNDQVVQTKAAKCCDHLGVVSQKSWLAGFAKGDMTDTIRDDESERAIRRFIDEMNAIGARQVDAIVATLRRKGLQGRDLLNAVTLEVQRSEWVKEIAAAARPYIENALRTGGISGAAMLPTTDEAFGFEFANPEVSRYVDRATTKLATGVNETTTMRVRDVIGQSLERGATIDEIAAEVTTRTGIDGARAEMIARTESAKAYVQGQVEAWKQSGVVVGKRWLLAPDACEFCRAVAREYSTKTVALGDSFYPQGHVLQGVSGGSLSLDYESIDGAPLHPGCRCDVVPVIDPELTGGAV